MALLLYLSVVNRILWDKHLYTGIKPTYSCPTLSMFRVSRRYKGTYVCGIRNITFAVVKAQAAYKI